MLPSTAAMLAVALLAASVHATGNVDPRITFRFKPAAAADALSPSGPLVTAAEDLAFISYATAAGSEHVCAVDPMFYDKAATSAACSPLIDMGVTQVIRTRHGVVTTGHNLVDKNTVVQYSLTPTPRGAVPGRTSWRVLVPGLAAVAYDAAHEQLLVADPAAELLWAYDLNDVANSTYRFRAPMPNPGGPFAHHPLAMRDIVVYAASGFAALLHGNAVVLVRLDTGAVQGAAPAPCGFAAADGRAQAGDRLPLLGNSTMLSLSLVTDNRNRSTLVIYGNVSAPFPAPTFGVCGLDAGDLNLVRFKSATKFAKGFGVVQRDAALPWLPFGGLRGSFFLNGWAEDALGKVTNAVVAVDIDSGTWSHKTVYRRAVDGASRPVAAQAYLDHTHWSRLLLVVDGIIQTYKTGLVGDVSFPYAQPCAAGTTPTFMPSLGQAFCVGHPEPKLTTAGLLTFYLGSDAWSAAANVAPSREAPHALQTTLTERFVWFVDAGSELWGLDPRGKFAFTTPVPAQRQTPAPRAARDEPDHRLSGGAIFGIICAVALVATLGAFAAKWAHGRRGTARREAWYGGEAPRRTTIDDSLAYGSSSSMEGTENLNTRSSGYGSYGSATA
jgi:hypothetical protein